MTLRLKQYYEFGPFRLDVAHQLLFRGGRVVAIPPKALEALLVLVQKRGETAGRAELIKAVWPDSEVDERTLSFTIFKLRRALGESASDQHYVATVQGRGYRFMAGVREVWDEGEAAMMAQSLAVLPFRPLNPSGTEGYLGLGMADALITKLANLRQIRVRPTSAVRNYGLSKQDPFAAGRTLRAGSVLEGSIRRSADRIQVAAQLVSVPNESALWADRFDEKFSDIFTVEDRISEQVGRALALQLTENEMTLLTKHYTENSDAYLEYLKGRYSWNRRTEEGTKRAIECFERAIKLDPDYALAYVGLADCYSLLSFYSVMPPKESFPRAKQAAIRALELDESLAEAHASLAYTKLYYDWDWVGAEKEFRRSISLNANYATARHWYHEFLLAMGWFDEAMAEVERAHEIDPLSPAINAALVLPLLHAGEYDKGIEQLHSVIDLEPDFYRSHLFLGAAYTQKREYTKAIAEFQVAMILSEGSTRALAALGYAYAISGKRSRALKALENLKSRSEKRYVSPYAIAMIYAGLGEKDQAFEWLERAYEERDEWLIRLKVAPELANLRSDARFVDLLRRVGLAP